MQEKEVEELTVQQPLVGDLGDEESAAVDLGDQEIVGDLDDSVLPVDQRHSGTTSTCSCSKYISVMC